MGLISKEVFVCFDCETTGLDPEEDRIIEFAARRFTLSENMESFETLINPGRPIPQASQAIHHISNEMVADKPPIEEVLQNILDFIGGAIVVGHSIEFDIAILDANAKRLGVISHITSSPFIDTLRLARLYGESPLNSLQGLRKHFNISDEGAHRAMSDVEVNIAVFKQLVRPYKTTADVLKVLERPIAMRTMPLGKYKGRIFKEVPTHYLTWASHQDFDRDLLFSIRRELKSRRVRKDFSNATNPFQDL